MHLAAPGRSAITITADALLNDPTFEVVDGRTVGSLPSTALFDTLPEQVQERARWWERHLTEVIDGAPCAAEAGTRPKPEYDPAMRSMRQREHAKRDELVAAGEQVALRTLQRMRVDYERDGLMALVDGRHHPRQPVASQVDQRVAGPRNVRTSPAWFALGCVQAGGR